MQTGPVNLIADIGGTNVSFALVEGFSGVIHQARTFQCGDFTDLFSAIDGYLRSVSEPDLQQAVFSLATSVDDDQLSMTNSSWFFSVSQLRETLGLSSLKVINDFTALALALPGLTADDYWQLGGGHSEHGQTKAIIGPGTGLGVSAIVNTGSGWWPLQGEGGHVSYGPLDFEEAGVIEILRGQFDHVSAERLICGSGLLLLYQTMAGLGGHLISAKSPEEVTALALQKKCPAAERALSMFCSILGSVAGNLALTLGAKGGVYLGGGILPRLGSCFAQSGFRERFEKHGRFESYLEKIPTYVLQSNYIALRGAALALDPEYNHLGITSVK